MTSAFLERIHPYSGVNDTLAQAQWAEKKWMWLIDKEQGYIAVSVVAEHGDTVEIETANGQVCSLSLSCSKTKTVSANDLEKMNPPKFDRAEDMADLTYLNEASVIHNLRLRYSSSLIYVPSFS